MDPSLWQLWQCDNDNRKVEKKVQRHCRVPGIFFKDNVTGRDIGLKNGTAVGHKGHPRGPDSPARQEF